MSRKPLYARQAERRKIAAQVLVGILPGLELKPEYVVTWAEAACSIAEALIAELDRREAEEVEAGNVEEPTR